LDEIGYYVVCDLSRHVFAPRLVLTDDWGPEMRGEVFRLLEPLVFDRYDRAFRL
jgi:hypothetical protein